MTSRIAAARRTHDGSAAAPCDVKGRPRVPLSCISANLAVRPAAGARGPAHPARAAPAAPFRHTEVAIGDRSDPQDVTEYEHIIYHAMREREVPVSAAPVPQTEITPRHRAFLVDWMCRLNYTTQIATESLYRAVGIVDRAIRRTQMSPHRLTLVGAAAMLIASKIEDTVPMPVADACAVADNAFSPQDLLRMETQLINLVEFDTEFPTPLFFLTIFLKLNGRTQETMLLARYLCELCMTAPEFVGARASAIAATALMMTRTLAGDEPWTEALAGYTRYGFEDLCGYGKTVHRMLLDRNRKESEFMRRKYASEPFCNVAGVPVPYELPVPFPFYD